MLSSKSHRNESKIVYKVCDESRLSSLKWFESSCQRISIKMCSSIFQRSIIMNNTEFSKNATAVATNIQKIVQNVSSMQRMLVHVDNQVWTRPSWVVNVNCDYCQGDALRQQLRQLQHYTGQLAKDTTSQLKLLTEQQPYGDTGAKIQVIFYYDLCWWLRNTILGTLA